MLGIEIVHGSVARLVGYVTERSYLNGLELRGPIAEERGLEGRVLTHREAALVAGGNFEPLGIDSGLKTISYEHDPRGRKQVVALALVLAQGVLHRQAAALFPEHLDLIDAVERAAERAFEKEFFGSYAKARFTPRGQPPQLLPAQGFLLCTHHPGNRNTEWAPHTHLVVPARVLLPDGSWRALDVRTVLRSILALDRTYQATFAAGLSELGFRVVKIDDHRYELADFPRGVLRGSRREQIRDYMQQHGLVGGRGSYIAQHKTRLPKDGPESSRAALIEKARAEITAAGHDIERLRGLVLPSLRRDRALNPTSEGPQPASRPPPTPALTAALNRPLERVAELPLRHHAPRRSTLPRTSAPWSPHKWGLLRERAVADALLAIADRLRTKQARTRSKHNRERLGASSLETTSSRLVGRNSGFSPRERAVVRATTKYELNACEKRSLQLIAAQKTTVRFLSVEVGADKARLLQAFASMHRSVVTLSASRRNRDALLALELPASFTVSKALWEWSRVERLHWRPFRNAPQRTPFRSPPTTTRLQDLGANIVGVMSSRAVRFNGFHRSRAPLDFARARRGTLLVVDQAGSVKPGELAKILRQVEKARGRITLLLCSSEHEPRHPWLAGRVPARIELEMTYAQFTDRLRKERERPHLSFER